MILLPSMWKFMKYFNMGMERKHNKALRIIHKFSSEIVKSTKVEIDYGTNNINVNQCFNILLTFMKLEADKDVLLLICLSVILASRDTSSSTLSYFFWLLSKHPNVE
eukprot:Gb_12618 [translate_table: standard]